MDTKYLKILFLIVAVLLLTSCTSGCARDMALAEGTPKGGSEGGSAAAATFLIEWGYWAITAGILATILSAPVIYFTGKHIGGGVLVFGLGSLFAGVALVFIGPWLAIVIGILAALILVAIALFGLYLWKHRDKIEERFEERFGFSDDIEKLDEVVAVETKNEIIEPKD